MEALPVILAYGESAALPSLGKALTVNSGKAMLADGAFNFGEQYIANGMGAGVWGKDNLMAIDIADTGLTALTPDWITIPLKSEINYSLQDGFQFSGGKEFSENMFYNGLKFKGAGSLGKLGKGLNSSLKGTTGSFYNQGGQFIIKSIISTGKSKIAHDKKVNENGKNQYRD